MKRLTDLSPIRFVIVGSVAYAAMRTLPAILALRGSAGAILSASIISILAFAWVVALLVAAVKRRQRTPNQATGEFILAVGLGYIFSVIATTPQRVQLDPSQSLGAILPLLLLVLVFAMAFVGLVARGIIGFFRRKDVVGQVDAPPA
jgi:hypothetical protein